MVVSDPLLLKYIGILKAKQEDYAKGGMLRPKRDPFEHGEQVGRYQGLHEALQLLEEAIEEAAIEEQSK